MRSIVLSGMMGSGKTSVGERLAARLGLPFVDTDRRVEQTTGKTVAALWREEGELAFRQREQTVAREILEGPPCVVAAGGGTLMNRELRHLAVDRAFIVTLTAEPQTLLARVGKGRERPNLGAQPEHRVHELLEARKDVYGECHLSVSTEDVDPDAVVDAIVPGLRDSTVLMPLGRRSYLIEFCNNAAATLTDRLASLAPSSIVVVSDSNVQRAAAKALTQALAPLAIEVARVVLPAGEVHKTVASVGAIWDGALGFGIDRDAVLVGFGGGVVGDLTGFAASALLRGVRFLQVPTTLLSMVDSSVGGKTGFDHPTGKNLIGAFYQPSGVVVDIARLKTLHPRERVAGFAEIVKIAVVMDAGFLGWLEEKADVLAKGEEDVTEEAIRRAVILKARVVRDDERDEGGRLSLNLGHTVGHALEAYGDFRRYRHGEAVAIGMVSELAMGERMEVTEAGLARKVADLCRRLGLPTSVPKEELAAAWTYAGRDKKRERNHVRLPIVTSGGSHRIERVLFDRLRDAFFA